MCRLLAILSAFLLCPSIALSQLVTLPPQMSGSVGQTVVVVPLKVDGGAVKFSIDPGLKDITESLAGPGAKVNWRAVTADKAGTFKVLAWVAKGDLASDLACTTVAISSGPPVPVDPQPDAIIKIQKDVAAITETLKSLNETLKTLDQRITAIEKKPPPPVVASVVAHVSFVGAEKTAVALSTNNDPDLRAWLKTAEIKVHVLKDGDPLIATSGLTEAVAKAGGTPALVAQDSVGNIIAQGKLTTPEDVKRQLAPYLKKSAGVKPRAWQVGGSYVFGETVTGAEGMLTFLCLRDNSDRSLTNTDSWLLVKDNFP